MSYLIDMRRSRTRYCPPYLSRRLDRPARENSPALPRSVSTRCPVSGASRCPQDLHLPRSWELSPFPVPGRICRAALAWHPSGGFIVALLCWPSRSRFSTGWVKSPRIVIARLGLGAGQTPDEFAQRSEARAGEGICPAAPVCSDGLTPPHRAQDAGAGWVSVRSAAGRRRRHRRAWW